MSSPTSCFSTAALLAFDRAGSVLDELDFDVTRAEFSDEDLRLYDGLSRRAATWAQIGFLALELHREGWRAGDLDDAYGRAA
jgi:hypothetical protein